MMFWTLFIVLGASLRISASTSSCPCGYFDSSIGRVYTDSIIVYFNETQTIPDDVFTVQSYAHKSEIGWNSPYRQGAVPDNSVIANTSSTTGTALDLFLDPSNSDHLVNGASIESKRQDILHGTFRASMRGPGPWTGGSALSMVLQYNHSSSMEIDMLNTDNPFDARITTLINGEFPSQDLSVNYSSLEKGSNTLAPINPWEFVTVRMDWSEKNVNFTIAENRTRTVSYKKEGFASEPLPLIFKHWSTGDSEWMGGPPTSRTVANVAWVRAFFNSSTMTTGQHQDFDERCSQSVTCDVDDLALRGSTNYTVDALIPWKEPPRNEHWRIPSAVVAGSSSFFGLIALLNVLFRRLPWQKLLSKRKNADGKSKKEIPSPAKGSKASMLRSASSSTLASQSTYKVKWDESCTPVTSSSPGTPWEVRTPNSLSRKGSSNDMFEIALLRKKMMDNSISEKDFVDEVRRLRETPSTGSDGWSSPGNTLVCPTPELRRSRSLRFINSAHDLKSPETIRESMEICAADVDFSQDEKTKVAHTAVEEVPHQPTLAQITKKAEKGPAPTKRIDYLAGLVAVSCIGVTFIHFTLTFIPFAGGLSYGEHYKSEYWARWIATPIVLNPIWIGPFFTTSCRFLAERYLRDGKIADVAKKMLLRAPRMLIPCIIVAALEYFLIELDLTAKLQSLPSISWSTWPYVSNYPNFGWFLNEILELAYLIPNEAPAIVNHYCVGILWTIPVQLQFSYVTLLGAVMVRDIKTHWKRFAFYTWCIIANWYSLSWGSCFWLGLMIADLNATYSYVKWFHARPKLLYPFYLILWGLIITGPLFSLLEDRNLYPIMTKIRDIHPDPETGLPQGQVESMYPAYYEPRLNTLLFAGAIHMMTELSSWFQAFLSLKVWIWMFPHTFTIYLVHGLVFWTFGSWLCVTLARMEILPYWAICLILFLTCYTIIGIVVLLLTPLTEGSAIAACRNCWRWATEEPVPHRPTLEPFRKDLFLNRNGSANVADVEARGHSVVEVLDESNFGNGKGKSPFDGSSAASLNHKKSSTPFDDEIEVSSPLSSSSGPSKSEPEMGMTWFEDREAHLSPDIVAGLGIAVDEKK